MERLDFGAAVGGAKGDGGRGGRRSARGRVVSRRAGNLQDDGRPGGDATLDKWIAQQIELAESTQAGLAVCGSDMAEIGPVSAALAEFRGSIAVLLPHLGTTNSSIGAS